MSCVYFHPIDLHNARIMVTELYHSYSRNSLKTTKLGFKWFSQFLHLIHCGENYLSMSEHPITQCNILKQAQISDQTHGLGNCLVLITLVLILFSPVWSCLSLIWHLNILISNILSLFLFHLLEIFQSRNICHWTCQSDGSQQYFKE